jgi:hypothetical protein
MGTAMILYSVAPAEDGGHIVTGYTHGLSDAYVAEVNGLGEVIWENTYGGPARDRAYSVCRAHCSGYVVAGGTISSGSGEDDVWIFKIDESGNLLWERVYGGSNIEFAQSVVATPDGGYIVGGKTMSFGNGVQLWLLKVDDEGRLREQ